MQFKDCKLTGADLSEVRALGLTFERCLLISANLRKMSFRKERLDGLDFSEADLGGADFRDAVFEGCSLRGASLPLANFKGADLRGCDLGQISLKDAPLFRGAVISPRQATDLMRGFGVTVR